MDRFLDCENKNHSFLIYTGLALLPSTEGHPKDTCMNVNINVKTDQERPFQKIKERKNNIVSQATQNYVQAKTTFVDSLCGKHTYKADGQCVN